MRAGAAAGASEYRADDHGDVRNGGSAAGCPAAQAARLTKGLNDELDDIRCALKVDAEQRSGNAQQKMG